MRRQVNVCSAHSANPGLCSPLNDSCCRCAEIVIQNGCQVANRVTDVCDENLIHGITSEISSQRAGLNACALVNVKSFEFSKRGCFFDLAYLLCRLILPPPPTAQIFPLSRRITRKARYSFERDPSNVVFPNVRKSVL